MNHLNHMMASFLKAALEPGCDQSSLKALKQKWHCSLPLTKKDQAIEGVHFLSLHLTPPTYILYFRRFFKPEVLQVYRLVHP